MVDWSALFARFGGDAELANAERLAVDAIRRTPDDGAAYARRAVLAAARADAPGAAHYARVAYARGDRTVETRTLFGLALAAVGQAELSDRMREGLPPGVPSGLERMVDAFSARASDLLVPLGGPLAPIGSAALVGRDVAVVEAARPMRGRRLPEWLEVVDREPGARDDLRVDESLAGQLARGVEQVLPLQVRDGIDVDLSDEDATPLEVAHDPGTPQTAYRSPVTGRFVQPAELTVHLATAWMPALNPTPDLLAHRAYFVGFMRREDVLFAVELPGPVMTASGQPPRPLCRQMYFGASSDELAFVDVERPEVPPVRLPVSSVERMDVLNDDQQVSLMLRDGRQLHLDLRGLARQHGPSVRQLVQRLERALAD